MPYGLLIATTLKQVQSQDGSNTMAGVIQCEYCLSIYDPIASRWKCQYCGWKSNCCEGEALPVCSTEVQDFNKDEGV